MVHYIGSQKRIKPLECTYGVGRDRQSIYQPTQPGRWARQVRTLNVGQQVVEVLFYNSQGFISTQWWENVLPSFLETLMSTDVASLLRLSRRS